MHLLLDAFLFEDLTEYFLTPVFFGSNSNTIFYSILQLTRKLQVGLGGILFNLFKEIPSSLFLDILRMYF